MHHRLFQSLLRTAQRHGTQHRHVHATPKHSGADENLERILTKLTEIAEQSATQGQQPIDPWLLFKSVGVPIMAIFTCGLSGGFYLVSESIRRENGLYREHFDQKIDHLDAKIDGVEARIDQRIDDLRKDNQANFDRLYSLFQAQQAASQPKPWFSW